MNPYYTPGYSPNYGIQYPPYGVSYPGYAATNNAFTIVKSDKGDSVYALNSYDTLTLASGDTDNLIITGDKCNKKITFDLSSAIISNQTGTAPIAGELRLVTGTVTVNTTAVTANSRIFLTRTSAPSDVSLTVEYVVTSKIPGTSFTVMAARANGLIYTDDTSYLDWFLVN